MSQTLDQLIRIVGAPWRKLACPCGGEVFTEDEDGVVTCKTCGERIKAGERVE